MNHEYVISENITHYATNEGFYHGWKFSIFNN